MTQRYSFTALGSTFVVDAEYEFVRELGQGAYGRVVAMRHRRSGEECAIKKITNINRKSSLTKQCLREVKLLHHFRGHKNITCLYDMDIVFQSNDYFDEVYLYEELMEVDLHAIIRSKQPLTDAHFQYLIYQVLCGLKYIHSANVLHRDLKPANLLVNADCELKICDFGLARGYAPDGSISTSARDQGFMTDYLAMLWYRAPETLFSFSNYTTAIDVWSVGCILAELLGGTPIFKGKSFVDQLNQILHYLGTPTEDTLSRVGSPLVQDYIRSQPTKTQIPFATIYPHASPLAIDLLSQMLCFSPENRIGCEQALSHPYLQVWHDPADEPVCEVRFDPSFEEEDSINGMKKLIIEEVNSFRAVVRSQTMASGQTCREDSLPILSSDETISSPVIDNPGAQQVIVNSETSLPPVSTSITNDDMPSEEVIAANIHPQLAMTPVPGPQGSMPQTQPSFVPDAVNGVLDGSVHGAVPRACSPAALAPGQADANTSLGYPVIAALQSDLTDLIARDGRDPIASGGFADIYRGMLKENGKSIKVAIKAIRTYAGEDGECSKRRKRLRREIKVWLDLRHINVLPLLGTTLGFGRFPAMVCPWAENGTLTSYLEDCYDSLSAVEVLGLLDNVASGLKYLHSCSVVHGDLSGSNVLICGDGRACIADFGLSMLLNELGASTFATSFHARGTLRWSAPELLDLEVPEDGMEEESPRSAPTTQSDVYSFGSVMLQILSGKVPYHYYTREAQVIHAVSKGMTPKRPSSALVTERRWTFIQRCWSTVMDDAQRRPLSVEIVEFTGEELAHCST